MQADGGLRMRTLVLTALGAWTSVWAGPAFAQPAELPARLVTLSGPTETFAKGEARWTAAKLRAELGPGDGVRTLPGGRLTVKTTSGQSLRLGQLTQLFFLEPEQGATGRPTAVRLDSGHLWVSVMPGAPATNHIEVRTQAATVTVRGTGAAIRFNPDGALLVRVYHGTAVCTGPGAVRQWERTLKQEQELLVSPAGAPGEVRGLTRDREDAAWVKWNADQDAAGGYGTPLKP